MVSSWHCFSFLTMHDTITSPPPGLVAGTPAAEPVAEPAELPEPLGAGAGSGADPASGSGVTCLGLSVGVGSSRFLPQPSTRMVIRTARRPVLPIVRSYHGRI